MVRNGSEVEGRTMYADIVVVVGFRVKVRVRVRVKVRVMVGGRVVK